MSEEMTDKSIVVWHPCPSLSTTIPDARVFTSLCLLHDQVVLCAINRPKPLEYYLEASFENDPVWEITPADVDFIHDLLKLEREQVITCVLFDDVRPEWAEWNKTASNEIADLLSIYYEKKTESKQNPIARIPFILEGCNSIKAYVFSKIRNCPIISNDEDLLGSISKMESAQTISEVLAQSAICQLTLPDVRAIHVEDILEARTELKDELLEFRAGILKLTWLLYQQVQNKNDMKQIRNEADTLVNTVIKGSLLSLENRMKQHKKKGIRRMLFGTGRVLVEATKLFLLPGAAEKMISGGKTIFQLATEVDSAKLPEDQVVTYLYKLKGKLKT